jgi:hypothetical protein
MMKPLRRQAIKNLELRVGSYLRFVNWIKEDHSTYLRKREGVVADFRCINRSLTEF